MPFIPHTPDDTKAMLDTIGVETLEDLFDEIPEALRCEKLSEIPEGLTEGELTRLLSERAAKDHNTVSFLGAGAYAHFIPAVVWQIAGRYENYTAYTPYQAEASQGNLQLLYEFQTMIASLTGMDASNASLYDGASALAEAVLMAVRIKRGKQQRILVAGTLNPRYRETVTTIVSAQNITIEEIPFDEKTGTTSLTSWKKAIEKSENKNEVAAIVLQQPNFFGCLEEVDQITAWAKANDLLVIASCNPTSLALLSEPGCWGECGVDIVCGEGQPLGMPLASGGPYMGFLATRQKYVRQLPGRIVGRTKDLDGKTGYTLTLQAREQHIRRSKATSNICTNQGLLVTVSTIYMSVLGPKGLQQVAARSHTQSQKLQKALTAIDGVESVLNAPFFHEIVIRFPQNATPVLSALAREGIQGGYDLSEEYPQFENCILMNATEIHSDADIENFANTLKNILTKKNTFKTAACSNGAAL